MHEKAVPLIKSMVADRLIANFVRGSHIHQNAAALVDLGLAIVKLDGMYRGMFNPTDVRKICNLMSEEDGRDLERLLLARPFGDYNLEGWRQAAFRQGLLYGRNIPAQGSRRTLRGGPRPRLRRGA
jgi:hypothetical protein